MSVDHDKAEALFDSALKFKPEEREVFLANVCAGDTLLRRLVEELLEAAGDAEAFLPTDPRTISAQSPLTEKAGDCIGRYKLLQQIGEGGCGVVYMAEQEEPVRRRVALKVIKLGMDTKSVIARFEAERQALALMDHPNIAKVLDAGATEAGRPYFVMELVRGIKITDYCDQNNVSTRERLNLFIQVCHAIQHAHQKGIIHRDIKPSNILVSLHDGVPVPVVIDFGIAKATEQRLTDKTLFTAFEQFIGTPAYTSPEQAEISRLDIDTRSDIYALGVLLYELLTGKTPFDPKTLISAGLEEMRRMIREQEPVRPSTRLNALQGEELTTTAKLRGTEAPKLIHLLRGDLDWIVMKCLEKDRTRRYEMANGLAQDVERHMKQEPVVARPASTAYRMQKFVRRNKVTVTATALVAVALVLGILLSTWQAVRATRAEGKTEKALVNESAQRQKAEEAQASEAEQRRLAVQARELAQRNLYIANMNLAQMAWEQSNIGQLRQTLEDTQESPYRGFEWYYWQPKTHLALKTLRGHLSSVSSVAFSRDGQRIVSGSADNTARVWDAVSGRELLMLKGHTNWILSVAFSPDGQRIVTGSRDQTAKLWEAASGRELFTTPVHGGLVVSVAFSPDGQRIVGGVDNTARVWEADSGREMFTLRGHSSGVSSVAFSPDGQRIVTASADQTVKLWEAGRGLSADKTGGNRVTLMGHCSPVGAIAFSPDGQRIVTAGGDHVTRTGDQMAKVWEAASGRELRTLKVDTSWISSLAFSRDGRRIVTAGGNCVARTGDQRAEVWEAASGRELFTLNGHTDDISSVAYSPDGQRIVTGSWDRTARVWAAADGQMLFALQGHADDVSCVAYSPDGQRIVTGSGDGTVKVWDASSGNELLTIQGRSAGIVSVAFSPDGQRIVTGGLEVAARVWDVGNGRQLLSLKGHSDWIMSVAYSPDGRRIVTASDDRTARVWEAASGRELLSLKARDFIRSVVFSPDGQQIVTGSWEKTAEVWEAARPEQVTAWQQEERTDALAQERRTTVRARD